MENSSRTIRELKERTDLLALVANDTSLRRVAMIAGHGAEYAGPCPKCGGEDRFHCQPQASGGGRWFCRQCYSSWGDVIDYIQWRDGLTFSQARQALSPGIQRPTAGVGTACISAPGPQDRVVPLEPPPLAWQGRGHAFIDYTSSQLCSNSQALAYLHERGLSDDIIATARLGYNPRWVRDQPESWGLEGKSVALPPGITIPCFMHGQLWYIKIRSVDGNSLKYVAVRGSRKRGVVYGLDALASTWDLILVEGELNALTLQQELVGIASAISVGDAGNMPDASVLADMAAIPRWWSLYDCDAAGTKGACKLGSLSQRLHALHWPYPSLDANAAHATGRWIVSRIVPQIGPRVDVEGPARREAWLAHWLDGLDDAAFDAGPALGDPALRAWLHLLKDYNRLARPG